jgi:hypothetical protein
MIMIRGAWVFPSMTKGEIVGILVVVIDVNPSHGFWTARLMKVFGHEGKCTCRYKHPWMDSIHHVVSGGMWHVTWILMVEEK